MRQYPREILVKRHLGWRLRDTRTQKSLSREHLNRLIKMGKKVIVVDAQSKEYIARYDLHDVASKNAGQGKLSETARPITGSDAIILKRYFVQVFRETRTWKRVSRKHLALLAEKGTKIIVVDTTTKEY